MADKKRVPFVIAVDGPAGAGKSTVARGVARRLGFAHLDTGAMYRAATAAVLRHGVDPEDPKAVAGVLRHVDLGMSGGHVTVGGEPAGREIRSRRVSAAVSAVSAHPAVRRKLVRVQRAILGRGAVVAEGRDLGTVVVPRAPVKIYLTASIAERARRRAMEMHAAGDPVSLATLRKELARRDHLDSTRATSPLRPARDATVIDTTGRTARQVIDQIVKIAQAAGAAKR